MSDKQAGNSKLSQIDRFKEAARALGCDEDEKAFDEKLGNVVKQKLKEKPEHQEQPEE